MCLLLDSVAVLVFAPRLSHVLTRAGHARDSAWQSGRSQLALCC